MFALKFREIESWYWGRTHLMIENKRLFMINFKHSPFFDLGPTNSVSTSCLLPINFVRGDLGMKAPSISSHRFATRH